ncbi:MAG: hydantoinase/oxoprolinase family protein [Planctomycetia bacterium]|jgi:probable H4MPT-linked C1 transfer pathway protein
MADGPPSAPSVVALDVGGANLKAADGRGWTHAEPFPLWRDWRDLDGRLAVILRSGGARRVVATMTGEIADCYASRAAGVAAIVAAIVAAADAADCDAEPSLYLVDGRLVTPAEATARPLAAAASNWHALARLASTHAPDGRCLLVDIGSTTVDIVPLADRRPAPLAADDTGRLASGELVYTGMERTPLAAIVRTLPHGGVRRPVTSERFAESRDAWLLLGAIPEDHDCRDTADGGPLTRDAARTRIARTLLVEPAEFSVADAIAAATRCAAVQARAVARGLAAVARRCGWKPTSIVLSGHGDLLARQALARLGWQPTIVSLRDRIGPGAARCGPAHALALIARGEIP